MSQFPTVIAPDLFAQLRGDLASGRAEQAQVDQRLGGLRQAGLDDLDALIESLLNPGFNPGGAPLSPAPDLDLAESFGGTAPSDALPDDDPAEQSERARLIDAIIASRRAAGQADPGRLDLDRAQLWQQHLPQLRDTLVRERSIADRQRQGLIAEIASTRAFRRQVEGGFASVDSLGRMPAPLLAQILQQLQAADSRAGFAPSTPLDQAGVRDQTIAGIIDQEIQADAQRRPDLLQQAQAQASVDPQTGQLLAPEQRQRAQQFLEPATTQQLLDILATNEERNAAQADVDIGTQQIQGVLDSPLVTGANMASGGAINKLAEQFVPERPTSSLDSLMQGDIGQALAIGGPQAVGLAVGAPARAAGFAAKQIAPRAASLVPGLARFLGDSAFKGAAAFGGFEVPFAAVETGSKIAEGQPVGQSVVAGGKHVLGGAALGAGLGMASQPITELVKALSPGLQRVVVAFVNAASDPLGAEVAVREAISTDAGRAALVAAQSRGEAAVQAVLRAVQSQRAARGVGGGDFPNLLPTPLTGGQGAGLGPDTRAVPIGGEHTTRIRQGRQAARQRLAASEEALAPEIARQGQRQPIQAIQRQATSEFVAEKGLPPVERPLAAQDAQANRLNNLIDQAQAEVRAGRLDAAARRFDEVIDQARIEADRLRSRPPAPSVQAPRAPATMAPPARVDRAPRVSSTLPTGDPAAAVESAPPAPLTQQVPQVAKAVTDAADDILAQLGIPKLKRARLIREAVAAGAADEQSIVQHALRARADQEGLATLRPPGQELPSGSTRRQDLAAGQERPVIEQGAQPRRGQQEVGRVGPEDAERGQPEVVPGRNRLEAQEEVANRPARGGGSAVPFEGGSALPPQQNVTAPTPPRARPPATRGGRSRAAVQRDIDAVIEQGPERFGQVEPLLDDEGQIIRGLTFPFSMRGEVAQAIEGKPFNVRSLFTVLKKGERISGETAEDLATRLGIDVTELIEGVIQNVTGNTRPAQRRAFIEAVRKGVDQIGAPINADERRLAQEFLALSGDDPGFRRAAQKAIAKGKQTVDAETLAPGDRFEIAGEKHVVKSVDPKTGEVLVEDGITFELPEFADVQIDKGTLARSGTARPKAVKPAEPELDDSFDFGANVAESKAVGFENFTKARNAGEGDVLIGSLDQMVDRAKFPKDLQLSRDEAFVGVFVTDSLPAKTAGVTRLKDGKPAAVLLNRTAAMTEQQFDQVIAHETAHVKRAAKGRTMLDDIARSEASADRAGKAVSGIDDVILTSDQKLDELRRQTNLLGERTVDKLTGQQKGFDFQGKTVEGELPEFTDAGVRRVPIRKLDIVNEPSELESVRRRFPPGEEMPPIVVVDEGADFLVVDGAHRARLAAERGQSSIDAIVLSKAENARLLSGGFDDQEIAFAASRRAGLAEQSQALANQPRPIGAVDARPFRGEEALRSLETPQTNLLGERTVDKLTGQQKGFDFQGKTVEGETLVEGGKLNQAGKLIPDAGKTVEDIPGQSTFEHLADQMRDQVNLGVDPMVAWKAAQLVASAAGKAPSKLANVALKAADRLGQMPGAGMFGKQMVDRVRQQAGVTGRAIARKADLAVREADKIQGQIENEVLEMVRRFRGEFKMRKSLAQPGRKGTFDDRARYARISDLIEARPGQPIAADLTATEREFVDAYRGLLKIGAREAAVKTRALPQGMLVSLPGGKTRPFSPAKDSNRFLRHATPELSRAIANRSDLSDTLIEVLLKENGQKVTPDSIARAQGFLDEWIGMRSQRVVGALERERLFKTFPTHIEHGGREVPLLETDPLTAARGVVLQLPDRVGFTRIFGQDIGPRTQVQRLRARFVKAGGREEDFNSLIAALNNRPLRGALRVSPQRQPSTVFDIANDDYLKKVLFGVLNPMFRTLALSSSAIVNVSEVVMKVPAHAGALNLLEGTVKLLASPKATSRELRAMGAITTDLVDPFLRPGRRAQDFGRLISESGNRLFVNKQMNEGNERAAATAGKIFAEAIEGRGFFEGAKQAVGLKRRGLRFGERAQLRFLGFTEREINELAAAGPKPADLLDDLARKTAALTQGSTLRRAQRSALANNPVFRFWFDFQNYLQITVERNGKALRLLTEAVERGNPREIAEHLFITGKLTFGQAVGGTASLMLAGLAFGRAADFGRDGWDWFSESMMEAGVAGPVRTLSFLDTRDSVPEMLFKMTAKGRAVWNLGEAFFRRGRFANKHDIEIVAELLTAQTPAARVLSPTQGWYAAAVGMKDPKLDRAIRRYWNWSRKNDPRSFSSKPGFDAFRRAMGEVSVAVRRGDEKAAKAALARAKAAKTKEVEDAGDTPRLTKRRGKVRTSINTSLRARQLLGRLKESQIESLRKQLSPEDMRMLETYDAMLDGLRETIRGSRRRRRAG